MLPKLSNDPAELARVSLEKYGTGARRDEDVSRLGAFARGEVIRLRVTCPRRLGVSAVVLRLNMDGKAESDTSFSYIDSDYETGLELYELTLDTAALCGAEPSGLFWYRLLLVRAADTLFTDSRNNVDFDLVSGGGCPFRLLVYDPADLPPAWLGQGVMYHVFVDRFRKGEGPVSYPEGPRGALLDPDWDHGIPQYPEERGGELANNVFFGGNLWGVIEKLDYLQSLGVTVLYLSPIFKAYSNHKYDTGDYMIVDPGFGGEAALDALLDAAKARGMRVILDGVFNHTGDDSLYFNRYGTYPTTGAAQSEDSPFYKWFEFRHFPDEYASWWGIPILPKLNHACGDCRHYFTGPDGVGAHYIRKGVSGWRLDVADELCDDFLDEFHASVRASGTERTDKPVIIGEVWENAADKVAYGHRRRYLRGGQLDSVMNYPIRSGILAFVQDGDADFLYDVLTELYGSYPRPVSDILMNLLGTHDTERILTMLGSRPEDFDRPNRELAGARLDPCARECSVRLLKIASTLQFTVFGVPSVYYGDEAGMEGYHDPFCRMPFPWRDLDDPVRADLLAHYRALGALRRDPALMGGDFRVLSHGADWIVYERVRNGSRLVIAANRGVSPVTVPVPAQGEILLSVGGNTYGQGRLTVAPDGVCVIK
ncbi:MAG: glycoside hydrolase family 13 protein [Clostridia bacterium]|nr:glycoside hydrolase family 13 protein [Clostridia bacterium]